MTTNNVQKLVESFSSQQLTIFLRQKAPSFRAISENLANYLNLDDAFDQAVKIGVIELPHSQTVLVGTVHISEELTARSSKRKQYELVKRILKDSNHNAAIFAFYDHVGRFRLSLVTVSYHGTRRQFSTFRRYTFFVDPALPNKTFVQQMNRASFDKLESILQTFSLEAISDEFYKEFESKFNEIAEKVQGTEDKDLAKDFALLFTIRTIFIGFVQKKGWLGGNLRFLQDFWAEYQSTGASRSFYKEWLEPLFFEALNSPPGRKVSYGHAPFSQKTQDILQMAPYLNGELFKRKRGVDDQGLWLPDGVIGAFFDFLFEYNFTVEENELYDEELELNPEFLGIIFERITNKEQGAVYTPRVEVDLMCRLTLVKWLEQTTSIQKEDLYHLFFREAGTGQEFDEYQRQGDFSPAEIRTLTKQLESVTVCDPAAGSGAFEVGMLQVLDQVLENLYSRNNSPADLKAQAPSAFDRKKAIIANSLYGVEVKRWAVWINHLRLWLTLFVDMPDKFKDSQTPLLPNLTFKVRTGDSLVQRIGSKTFPVHGHASLPFAIRRQITELKKKKRDFFYNQSNDYRPIEQEELSVFRAILDAEIESRKAEIRKLLTPTSQQLDIFEDNHPTQQDLDLVQATQKAQREALEAEIAELEAQKRNLKDERPFIWAIEFAEIFFDQGGFDLIIGNPPYVRQESISDPNGRLSSKDYKAALEEMVRLDFPEYFAKSNARLDEFKKGRKPDGRSDLYTYFYIRSLRLLNPRGVHVFICSNSWLDVGYGGWLQEFFLRKAPLYLVIDNHAKRSFERADVNTIISVAGAPEREVPSEHVVRFVAFKRSFEEAAFSDNFIAIERALDIARTEDYRVVPLSAVELLREGSEDGEKELQTAGQYEGNKWGGKYLRAPDILLDILTNQKVSLKKLGVVANIRYGFKSGATKFFFIDEQTKSSYNLNGHTIPILTSSKEITGRRIVPDNFEYELLVFSSNKLGVRQKQYIQEGERKKYHKRSSLESNNPWYQIQERNLYKTKIVLLQFFDKRFFTPVSEFPIVISNSFWGVYGVRELTINQLILFLNSVIYFSQLELFGRCNMGEGVLTVYGEDLKQILIPWNLTKIDISAHIIQNYLSNESKDIFTECGIDPNSEIPIAEQDPQPLPDRKALDDIVFDALGLTEDERKEVYRAVCQLVWDRISKAKSV